MEFIFEDEETKTVLSGTYKPGYLYMDQQYFDFKNNELLQKVMIIDDYVFYGNTKIKGIVLPDQIQRIGVAAFGACINMEKIELPKELIRIEKNAFINCGSLTAITFHDKIVYLEEEIFKRCPLKEINFELPIYCIKLTETTFKGIAPKTLRIRGEHVNSSNLKDLKLLKNAGMSFENLQVEDESLQLLIEVGEL